MTFTPPSYSSDPTLGGPAITGLFDDPFYTGSGVVPAIAPSAGWDVALAGHRYQIDWDAQQTFSRQYRHESVPIMRQQSDASAEPAEASLNPEDLWRRGQATWTGGSGQTYLDKVEYLPGATYLDKVVSDRTRFRDSRGIDCWAEGQITLLPDTSEYRTITDNPAYLCAAGNLLYVLSGTTIQFTADLDAPSWTPVAPFATAQVGIVDSAASDGYHVWLTDGPDLFESDRNTSTYDEWHGASELVGTITSTTDIAFTTGTITPNDTGRQIADFGFTNIPANTTLTYVDPTHATLSQACTNIVGLTVAIFGPWNASLVRYAAGRLLSANGNSIYNNAGKATPTPNTVLMTHPNPDWSWTDVAAGPSAIYLAGFSGDKSMVYRTAVVQDGSDLGAPIVAGELPDGELCLSLCGYLGFLLIGTTKGIRFATLDAQGNIATLGDLIPTNACYCFEPQDRFVWFGWNNIDADSTGLGRADLRTFNNAAPAYATDLQAPTQGNCISVVTCQGRRAFSVELQGIYVEQSTLAPSGWLRTGWFAYGLPDPKTAVSLLIRNNPGGGEYQAALAVDRIPTYVQVSGMIDGTVPGGVNVSAGPRRAETFEAQFQLFRDADPTQGPAVTRWTLRANPGAFASKLIHVPVLLHTHQTSGTVDRWYGIRQEQAFLEGLRSTSEVVTYQEGPTSYSVIVEDFYFMPYDRAPRDGDGAAFDATMYLTLKTVV